MTTPPVPPIGSVWINKNTERLVVLVGMSFILGSHLARIRFVNTGIEIDEPLGMFTWNYVKLEDIDPQ